MMYMGTKSDGKSNFMQAGQSTDGQGRPLLKKSDVKGDI